MQIRLRVGALPWLLLTLSLLVWTASPAAADGLSGYVEYSTTFAKGRNLLGGELDNDVSSNSFIQRYNLSLIQSLYPQFRVTAGGMFERTDSDSTSNGIDASSSATQLSPYFGFTLGGGPVTASAGYSRNETSSSSSGGLGITEIFENYNARLTLRPEGLPSLSLLVSRANAFDKDRVERDTTSDFYSLSSRYLPNPDLVLNYAGSVSESLSRITGQKSRSVFNTLRGDYTRQFYKKVNFFSSATISSQMNESSGAGTGAVEFFAVAGYLTISDVVDPAPLSEAQLLPQLVGQQGGGRDQPTSISLGPSQVDTRRQLAFDFGQTPDLTRRGVNTIYVYVPLQDGRPLPSDIRGRFTWNVYSSTDGVRWSAVATGLSAGFEVFNDPLLNVGAQSALPNVSRFAVSFPTVLVNDPQSDPGSSIRYLKVVVSPLPLGTVSALDPRYDLSKLQVNKIEAFVLGAIPEQKTSSVSALANAGVRVRLYESASSSAMYDLNVSYNQSIPDQGNSIYSYFIATGLAGNHRFNSYLSGTGRVAAEQAGQKGDDARNTYSYSASLQAVPLTTLRHVLVVSGRYATSREGSSSNSSLFLTNTAQLYRGVSSSLTGGLSLAQNEDDSESKSTFLNFGMNLIPHRTLSVNLGYSETRSQTSGGDRLAGSNTNRSAELSAGYNPISAVFVFASLGYAAESDREAILTQSFGGSWSPFRDGALQLNTAYSESLSSAGDERTSTLSASLRYNIRPGWWLDSTYGLQNTESTGETLKSESRTESITATLRLNF